MRRYKKPLRLLAVILISILAINTLVLYYCFRISPTDIFSLLGNIKYKAAAYDTESGSQKDTEAMTEESTGSYGINQTGESSMGKITHGASCEGDTEMHNFEGSMNGDVSSFYMTENEVESLYSIGITDKLTVISILSKLEAAQLDSIVEISKNGVTSEEYYEIESIAQRELPSEDVETLRNIIDKYKMLYAQED